MKIYWMFGTEYIFCKYMNYTTVIWEQYELNLEENSAHTHTHTQTAGRAREIGREGERKWHEKKIRYLKRQPITPQPQLEQYKCSF